MPERKGQDMKNILKQQRIDCAKVTRDRNSQSSRPASSESTMLRHAMDADRRWALERLERIARLAEKLRKDDGV
jgi:hypothetical protein